MKKILITLAVFAFASSAFAHNPRNPRPGQRKKSVTVVHGKRALAIFTALDAEVVTVNRPRASVDMKKVAGLRCAKITKKATSKIKFRCVLKGKKPLRRRGHGRRGRGQGRQQGQASVL
jgi:hypothetical protein